MRCRAEERYRIAGMIVPNNTSSAGSGPTRYAEELDQWLASTVQRRHQVRQKVLP